MRPLRLARYWIALGWLLVAGLVVASLATVPVEETGLGAGDKLAHVLAYLLVMGWFAQIWRSPSALARHAAFLALLGIVLELLQGTTEYRSPDALDALANVGGILLGWLTARTPAAGLLERLEARLGSRASE